MPSNRITKINIDKDVKRLVKNIAALEGLSDTVMLERMILFYIQQTDFRTGEIKKVR